MQQTANRPTSVADLAGLTRRARRRLNGALLLDELGICAQWAFGAAAAGILIAKTTMRVPWLRPWHLLAAAALLMLPVWLARGRRRFFTAEEAAGWLEARSRAGGTLLAAARGRFARGAPPAAAVRERLPHLRLRPAVSRLLLPGLLLAGALLIPAGGPENGAATLGTRRRIARTQRRIDALRRERLLSPEETRRLEEEAQRLLAERRASPESLAEAADRLATEVDRQVLAAAEEARETLQAAETLSRAASGADVGREAVRKALARARQSLPPEALEAAGAASGDGQTAAPAGAAEGADPQRLQQLAEALERQAASQLGAAGRQRGQLGGEESRRGLSELTGGPPGLSELSGRMPGAGREGDGEGASGGTGRQAAGAGSRPRQGQARGAGVDRGPGEAELLFGAETAASGSRFEALRLPPGETLMPGEILRRGRLRPGELPPAAAAPGARTAPLPAGPVSAERAREALGPYRRRVADQYFRERAATPAAPAAAQGDDDDQP